MGRRLQKCINPHKHHGIKFEYFPEKTLPTYTTRLKIFRIIVKTVHE